MEHEAVVAGLLAKRAEIESQIAELERQVRKHRTEVQSIDKAILLFEPSLVRAKAEVTQWRRSAHFVTGELTRRCQTALREAQGRPITADAITVDAMREKGLDLGDGALRMDIQKRLLWTLNRMLARGAVTKEGFGAEARWGVPHLPD